MYAVAWPRPYKDAPMDVDLALSVQLHKLPFNFMVKLENGAMQRISQYIHEVDDLR